MTITDIRQHGERGLPPSMVERVTLIMDAFERRTTTLTLEQVTARTGLPRSTAHRILDQLVQVDWLGRGTYGYALGSRALAFGGRDGSYSEIRAAAAPVLQKLFLLTGLVVQLGVLAEGNQVYYLDKIGGKLAAAVPSRVGDRVPAHGTAIGKALLAWVDPERVDEMAGGGDLFVLHRELSRIRSRRGLAFEGAEPARGIASVATAIRSRRHAVAAISLCGPVRVIQLERAAPLVLDAARAVSQALFPGSAEDGQ